DQHVIRADLAGEGPIDAHRTLEVQLAVELGAPAEERVQGAIRWCVCSILHRACPPFVSSAQIAFGSLARGSPCGSVGLCPPYLERPSRGEWYAAAPRERSRIRPRAGPASP